MFGPFKTTERCADTNKACTNESICALASCVCDLPWLPCVCTQHREKVSNTVTLSEMGVARKPYSHVWRVLFYSPCEQNPDRLTAPENFDLIRLSFCLHPFDRNDKYWMKLAGVDEQDRELERFRK